MKVNYMHHENPPIKETICELIKTATKVYPNRMVGQILCDATARYNCALDHLRDTELLECLREHIRASARAIG